EALVAANRDASRRPILAGLALDHVQRRIPLGVTGGAGEFGIDHKAAAVLHENVADEAQLRALSWAFAVEPCVRIGRRGVCLVRTLLAVEVDFGVASLCSWALIWITLRIILRWFLCFEALHRGPGLDDSAINREVFGRQEPLHLGPLHFLEGGPWRIFHCLDIGVVPLQARSRFS